MNRELMYKNPSRKKIWDIVIIGGGASGFGTAVDATSRGFNQNINIEYINLKE